MHQAIWMFFEGKLGTFAKLLGTEDRPKALRNSKMAT